MAVIVIKEKTLSYSTNTEGEFLIRVEHGRDTEINHFDCVIVTIGPIEVN